MSLGRVIIDILIVGVLAIIAYYAPIPAPFKWVAWLIVFVIALVILLPLAGVRL
jgi:hypothetical protein